jgi:hypothetical protein
MTIKCELTMLTFTKTKNTRLPDSVHNAGVTLQSRDIPHTLPSPIFYERAPSVVAQGIPLRIVGYVERIVPGLTNRQFQMHFRVSRSSFENFVPIIENIIKKCIKTP